jgi:hypothetical protein
VLFLGQAFASDADKIADRIWKNECAGTKEGLTHWNQGENFASLGIGHFIWYPAAKKERFQETFPALLEFLQKEGASLPTWLKTAAGCPWKSREAFYEDIDSLKMKSLREFLFDTKSLQARFIVNRLEQVLPSLLEQCSPKERESVSHVFSRLAQDDKGLYALLDYLNFKGSGTSPHESYQGKGWGLLQVLKRVRPSSQQLLVDFVQAGKAVLTERVRNAPEERHEEQWLPGWFHRIDTYIKE